MVAVAATYMPSCIICGPHARCDLPSLEGTITKVERRARATKHGTLHVVRIQLQTQDGQCRLDLGERFEYLGAGLAEAPEGLALRAYHLRRARVTAAADQASPRSAMPAFLTGAESVVVLEPDWLLDVTALAGTDYCLRQWLANRLAARPATVQQLRGNVVHTCFQTLCREGAIPDDLVASLADDAAYGLALAGVSRQVLIDDVESHIGRLQAWHEQFGGDLFGDTTADPCYESTLLCPELGLRGRIDLALRRAHKGGPPLVTRVVELKTGKYNEQWPDPEFQVRGYYAILASQQRLAPDFRAQVIYTGGASYAYRHIACGPEHIEHVVTRRNQAVLAQLVGHAPQSSAVKRCRMSANRADCVKISALLNLDHCQGRDLQDASNAGIDPADADFYSTQYRLLRLESRATSHELAGLWRTGTAEREAAGTAISLGEELDRGRDRDGHWWYRFGCRNNSELRVGDTVLLSDGDPVRGEVAVASIVSASIDVIEVQSAEPVLHPTLVDRYQSGKAQDRTLRGLHAWMSAPPTVRALFYGLRAPEFAPPSPGAIADEFTDGLNGPQAEALGRALSTQGYLLVQGPPGTGKTHLIARVARALAARGERIIIAAWTNQAVDTMLHALIEQGFTQFARLGSSRSMDEAMLPFAVAPAIHGSGDTLTPEMIGQRLQSIPVLAGTVSAFADQRIRAATVQRDIVILDEAAQLSLAASVGVLRLADRFILVGDDQQLPPVVQSDDAAREGLSLSPFALLRPDAQAHGALIALSVQFRMHSAIAAWPSEAFYGGSLAAHPSVANRRLPAVGGFTPDFLAGRDVPLVLVDTGSSAATEVEAAVNAAISLHRSGVPAREIGVVAPFRAIVAAVRRRLESMPDMAGCTVDTVDRFQGGQREAIIVCLGLASIERRTHAFVDDPRRINVAFTRARAKLIVLGDLRRAQTLSTLAGFLHHCIDHGMPVVRVQHMPPNAASQAVMFLSSEQDYTPVAGVRCAQPAGGSLDPGHLSDRFI